MAGEIRWCANGLNSITMNINTNHSPASRFYVGLKLWKIFVHVSRLFATINKPAAEVFLLNKPRKEEKKKPSKKWIKSPKTKQSEKTRKRQTIPDTFFVKHREAQLFVSLLRQSYVSRVKLLLKFYVGASVCVSFNDFKRII